MSLSVPLTCQAHFLITPNTLTISPPQPFKSLLNVASVRLSPPSSLKLTVLLPSQHSMYDPLSSLNHRHPPTQITI